MKPSVFSFFVNWPVPSLTFFLIATLLILYSAFIGGFLSPFPLRAYAIASGPRYVLLFFLFCFLYFFYFFLKGDNATYT